MALPTTYTVYVKDSCLSSEMWLFLTHMDNLRSLGVELHAFLLLFIEYLYVNGWHISNIVTP